MSQLAHSQQRYEPEAAPTAAGQLRAGSAPEMADAQQDGSAGSAQLTSAFDRLSDRPAGEQSVGFWGSAFTSYFVR